MAGLVSALVFLTTHPIGATTVIPPTFVELVSEAESIHRGKVMNVRCEWVNRPDGRVIKTFVTFAVQRTLKGHPAKELTLQLSGGTLDGVSDAIVGVPQFSIGQMDIVFVRQNGVSFCPLVGMMHGRYRIQTDHASGREYVARDDGVPIESEHEVQLVQRPEALVSRFKQVERALTPQMFEARIQEEVVRRGSLQ